MQLLLVTRERERENDSKTNVNVVVVSFRNESWIAVDHRVVRRNEDKIRHNEHTILQLNNYLFLLQ